MNIRMRQRKLDLTWTTAFLVLSTLLIASASAMAASRSTLDTNVDTPKKQGMDLGPAKEKPGSSHASTRGETWDGAWAKFYKGDYDGCIADCDTLISHNPSYSEAYSLRGYALLSKGDNYGAIADASHACILGPDLAFPYLVKAEAEYKTDDYKSVIVHCTRAIELGFDAKEWLSTARYYRGRASDQIQEQGNALLDYGLAAELNPSWSLPLWYRCHLNKRIGANKDCLNDGETLVKLFPNDPDSYKALGRALEVNQRKEEAIAAYQKAKELYEQQGYADLAKDMDDDIKRLQTTA